MSLADRISVMNGGHIVQAASPVEVYRNPAARVVGSFIGNPPMNVLPARRGGDGRYHVASITLAGPSNGGAELEFAIRPEDLTLAPGGLKATARVIEPLGAHTLVTTDVEGALFRAVLESDIRVAPGDELSLAPRPIGSAGSMRCVTRRAEDWSPSCALGVGQAVAPEMRRANPPPINFIGHAAHVALYGFLVGNSCTTALNSKPVNQAMAPVSGMGRFVLIPLIAAHVTGALAEHVVFKTDSLVRMLGADRK